MSSDTPAAETAPLGTCRSGYQGTVSGFVETQDHEIQRQIDRLREIGFAEGLNIEILHENPFGRDPIAVRIGVMTVALRRTEANLIEVSIA